MTKINKNTITIAAISSPFGLGAIGIIRLSGSESLKILQSIFKSTKTISFSPRKMYLGHVIDFDSKNKIDQVLAVYFKAPYSYTGEDIVEIQAHGGPEIMRLILKSLLKAGAKLAQPGEFTKRAFFSQKIDLNQAEAVAELIQAKNETAIRLALRQLEGGLSSRINNINDKILNLLAQITAELDFPEEEIESLDYQNLAHNLEKNILKDLIFLIAAGEAGEAFKSGFKVILAGRPNAGKSSLFNALLMEDRAIVTNIAGTTRDVLSSNTTWQGLNLELNDTAGLGKKAADLVEEEGQKRTKTHLKSADLVLWVHDLQSEALVSNLESDISELKLKKMILVLNKNDKSGAHKNDFINDLKIKNHNPVLISAKTGAGLDELKKTIFKKLTFNNQLQEPEYAPNTRHQEALKEALFFLTTAQNSLKETMPLDIIALDLKEGFNILGQITGQNTKSAVLDEVFAQFCLGK